ncbi:PREDICTED: UDP-xylose and UDP-N-acetylglucosamine transporter-like [Priapulus caudatus]|uniref:UDP-xylose and UDP-N-acetylglucosamine transporter-like n=1 Tax=Priapulus caudatus TaxID=37621 RepID=A0ABM1EXN8_PRICU|nr:PREDICTED: UDP-xylose and UDP-N-acetylglucosamine transporter-like [Priapulus caudatus]
MVAMFFSVSILNNYALSFHIAMPLHMVFRAGSLVANMLLSLIILKRRYKASKYVAVAMVTAGIATCTIVSGQQVHGATDTSARWLTGIGILAVAQLLAAGLGVYQEILYAHHGKHPRESLFYSMAHASKWQVFVSGWQADLRFYAIGTNIATTVNNRAATRNNNITTETKSPTHVNDSATACTLLQRRRSSRFLRVCGSGRARGQSRIPPPARRETFGCFFLSDARGYAGVRAVYVLTTECASLSVTLVITLRKFLSLLISIFYFGNPFTVYHWLGTALVFSGTFLFVDGFGIASRLSTRHPEKSD